MTTEDAPQALGQLVRQRRELQGITINHLSHALGVSPSTIYRFEDGRTTPRAGTIARMIRELGLDIDEVVNALGPGRLAEDVVGLVTAAESIHKFTDFWLTRGLDTNVEGNVDLVCVHDDGATVLVQVKNPGRHPEQRVNELIDQLRHLGYIVTRPVI